MISKVFQFNNTNYLFCREVTLNDGVWRGRVVKGAWWLATNWWLVYNTKTGILKGYASNEEERAGWASVVETKTNLTWMCDPIKGDYHTVIADAEKRFWNKEQSCIDAIDYEYETFKKLKAKYENDEYDQYLELKERYEPEEDNIPF